jgi:hypothetical protein
MNQLNSPESIASWEVNSGAGSWEAACLSYGSQVQYRFHNSPPIIWLAGVYKTAGRTYQTMLRKIP